MCCNQERLTLKEYSQNGGGTRELRQGARDLQTNLLGLCGVVNSHRTHTASLLAGETIEGAEQMKKAWASKRQEAVEFIARHHIPPPSQ